MKKAITLIIALLMVIGLAGNAFAADPADGGPSAKVKHAGVKDLQGWDTLVQAREEGKELRQAIKADFAQLKELAKEARENKNKEALAQLKELRGQVKPLREEIKQMETDKKAAWQSLKDAKQANDTPGMQAALDRINNLKSQINEKLSQVKGILEQAIGVFR